MRRSASRSNPAHIPLPVPNIFAKFHHGLGRQAGLLASGSAYFPRLPIHAVDSDLRADFVPGYSSASATDLHRTSLTIRPGYVIVNCRCEATKADFPHASSIRLVRRGIKLGRRTRTGHGHDTDLHGRGKPCASFMALARPLEVFPHAGHGLCWFHSDEITVWKAQVAL